METSPTLEAVVAKVIKRWSKTDAKINEARALAAMTDAVVTTRTRMNFTICQISARTLPHDAVGVAKCSPTDRFRDDVGADIALFRAVEDMLMLVGALVVDESVTLQ